jgi:hypothetical protein
MPSSCVLSADCSDCLGSVQGCHLCNTVLGSASVGIRLRSSSMGQDKTTAHVLEVATRAGR